MDLIWIRFEYVLDLPELVFIDDYAHHPSELEAAIDTVKRLFPKNLWNKLHLQIIYYGREFCPARGWNIENDIISKTVGRKSIINKLI